MAAASGHTAGTSEDVRIVVEAFEAEFADLPYDNER